MNIKVKFFEDKFVEAIGAGIYEIYVQINSKEELLYVGESVFVLVRCATHLYEIISDKKMRKAKEKEVIKDKHPRMQSGISDRVKSIENMISEMTDFLNK